MLLKSDLDVHYKPTTEAGLLNKGSCSARTLGVTKIDKYERYDFGHTVMPPKQIINKKLNKPTTVLDATT